MQLERDPLSSRLKVRKYYIYDNASMIDSIYDDDTMIDITSVEMNWLYV